MGIMEVLTTRTLRYTDDDGDEKDLVLTIYRPFEAEKGTWSCGFLFDPPIRPKVVFAHGWDFFDAFVRCLQAARINLETSKIGGRVRWGELLDCGLPWHTTRPRADEPSDVLMLRNLRFREKGGEEGELALKVFVPFKAEDERWRCAYTFGPPFNTTLAHGYGDDYTEALLDCLASARESLEILDPFGRIYSINRNDLADLPRKIGRSFWLGTTDEPLPDPS